MAKRPELTLPPELYYNEEEARKYTQNCSSSMSDCDVASGFHKKEESKRASAHRFAQLQRGRLLQLEEAGSLEFERGDSRLSQSDILAQAPIAAGPSHFELQLQYGPYRVAYDSSGRQLGICGAGGHVAAFEWRSKRLLFETHVKDACRDVAWIGAGVSPQLAVAQANWTFVYDCQGIELHCLKRLYRANRLLWLPKHWLLAAATDTGYLHWQDASTGSTVASYCGHRGPLRVAELHSDSGCVLTGHATGSVCAWTPLDKRPVVQLLCCSGGVRAAACSGSCVLALGGDSRLTAWDLRQLRRPLAETRLRQPSGQLAASQRGLLAASLRQSVAVLPDIRSAEPTAGGRKLRPLFVHASPGRLSGLAFCPWEDALAFGHSRGVGSLVAPGAGEANADGLSGAHPLAARRQRREAEVRALLDKLPPETIRPPGAAGLHDVDEEGIEEALERKRAAVMALPSASVKEFRPRRRQKGGGKSAKVEQRKVGVKWQRRRSELRQLLKSKRRLLADLDEAAGHRAEPRSKFTKPTTSTFLDRLIPKAE